MGGGFDDDCDYDGSCDGMGSGRGSSADNDDGPRSIVHSVSPDGAMHLMNASSRGGIGDIDDDDCHNASVPPPPSPLRPSSIKALSLPRFGRQQISSPIKKQKRSSGGGGDGNGDDDDKDTADDTDRLLLFHRPRYCPDDQSSSTSPSSSSSEASLSDDRHSEGNDDAECDNDDGPLPSRPPPTDGGGGGDTMITPPSSFLATLLFSTPPPIAKATTATTPPGLFGISIPPRSWSSPPRRLPGGGIDDDIDEGRREGGENEDNVSPSSSRRRHHRHQQQQQQHPRNQQQHRRRQFSLSSANATNDTLSDDGPFTPRGRKMMQQLSIGGVVGCHDSSWSSTSSSVVSGSGGGGDCPARRVVGAMTTRPTFRSTSRPWGVNNDASSTTALLSSSPGKSLGLLSASFAFETTVSSGDNGPVAGDFVPSSLSSLGESGHSVVSTSTTHFAFATPQPTPKRPPHYASPNRACRTTTPIGRQRGSVFQMPPPRSTPLAIAHPPVATSSSMTTPMCEDYGFPSSSNHACSSPQSSLESTVSTCASRQVPLTVLSRDGSPVVQRSSAWPSAAASSPLIRSLDNASLPQTAMMPTTLPSLHRSEDAGNTPRGAAKTTGLPLPKIRLTPRGGGHGLSLVHSPIMLEENDCDDHTHYGLRPTFPTKFSPIPPVGIDHPPLRSASLSSFGMGDDEVIAEMDSLLDRFGHHKASADHIQGCDLLPPHGSLPEDKADPSTRLAEEGEAVDGLDRVESEEAEMVALLNHDPTSPRRNHHCFHSRPMPSITLNLETIEGQHGLSLSKSPSFLPRPVPFVQGGTRSLFDTTKDPIEGILLADAIAEAAKSNEPLTDDEGSEFEGNHSDFLLSLPLSDHRSGDSHVAPLSSVPSLDLPQAETNLMTVRRRYSFRPRRPSVDSADVLGDPWDAIGGHVPSGAVVQEGLNKRAFSDAALRDSPSAPSSMELATSVPKYSRPNASDSDAVMLMGLGPSPSAAACSLLSMSSLCGLNIIHEMSDPSFHASTPQLPLSESPECAGAAVKLFRSEFSECSLGFSIDSNDGCVYQRDLFTPPVSMD